MFIRNKRAIIGLLVFVVVAGFMLSARLSRVGAVSTIEDKLEIYLRALQIVQTEYIEKEVDETTLIYGSIKGMLESLDDPYSRFMEPSAFREMNIRMSGSYSGIGIYIGLKDKQIVVISPISGTPADKAGLKAGDKILKIGQKITKDMSLDEAVSMIRGPAGTQVSLNILRSAWKEAKDFKISREKITIKSVESKGINGDIYYVKLNTFENQNAADEVEKAIDEARARKAKGMILDLRNNGGGLLRIAINIGSMFVEDGVIVYTVDRDGRKDTYSATGGRSWSKPMVVLVNEASASASEILAGALQDNGVATLVGTHTFGKACVQNVRPLDDGSAILLTVAKYFTPNGSDITKKGIMPDVVVELPMAATMESEEEPVISEKDDIQLKKAIDILEGKIQTPLGAR